jgi:hypothetical protein
VQRSICFARTHGANVNEMSQVATQPCTSALIDTNENDLNHKFGFEREFDWSGRPAWGYLLCFIKGVPNQICWFMRA